MDFCFSGAGVSVFVNFAGAPPNLKVVSLLSLGSSSSEVSFSSGSFRVDKGLMDLFSSFSASAALAATFAAAACASLVWAGLMGVSAVVETA